MEVNKKHSNTATWRLMNVLGARIQISMLGKHMDLEVVAASVSRVAAGHGTYVHWRLIDALENDVRHHFYNNISRSNRVP